MTCNNFKELTDHLVKRDKVVFILQGLDSILRRVPENNSVINLCLGEEKRIIQKNNVLEVTVSDFSAENISDLLTELNCLPHRFISFTEKFLLDAARLNDHFALGGNPIYAVENLCNKAKMREKLQNHLEFHIPYFSMVSACDLPAILKDIEHKVIIKPVDGVGSCSVYAFNPRVDTPSLVEHCFSPHQNVVIETFLQGPEYSVEGYSKNGKHEILAITEKEKNEYFVEVAHRTPPDLSNTTINIIQNTIIEFLDIIGLVEGPSHTEIIVNGNKVSIVESHPRTGGDRIVSLVRLTKGTDIIKRYLYELSEKQYCTDFPRGKVAVSFFKDLPYGVLRDIKPLATLLPTIEEAEILQNIGTTLQVPKSSDARHILIVGFGDNFELCQKNILKTYHLICESCLIE